MKNIILSLLLFTTINFAQSGLLLLYSGATYQPETLTYQARVLADGGEIINIQWLDSVIVNAKTNGWYDTLTIGVSAEFGVKKNINGKITKLYNIIGSIDLIAPDTSVAPSYSATLISNKPGINFFDFGVGDYLRTNDDSSAVSNYKTAKITAIFIGLQTTNSAFVLGVPNASNAHTAPYARWNIYHLATQMELRVATNVPQFTGNMDALKLISYYSELADYYENGTRVYNGTGASIDYPNATRFHLATSGGYAAEFSDLDLGTFFLFGNTISDSNRGKAETLINSHYDLY